MQTSRKSISGEGRELNEGFFSNGVPRWRCQFYLDMFIFFYRFLLLLLLFIQDFPPLSPRTFSLLPMDYQSLVNLILQGILLVAKKKDLAHEKGLARKKEQARRGYTNCNMFSPEIQFLPKVSLWTRNRIRKGTFSRRLTYRVRKNSPTRDRKPGPKSWAAAS